MTELMRIIKERRSIRKYEDKTVSDADLRTVLEAVRWSPSWANTQCWEVIVVRNPEVKEKLQETIAPKNPATKAITAAPVVLVLCGKKDVSGYYENKVTTKFGDWLLYDLGIATQSLCLAAHDLGLGTVIVGLFDHDKAREVLGVPDTHEVVTLVPMGHPAKISKAPERKEVDTFTHQDRF